jgi:CRISPR-associated exonuclease Cas4
VESFTDLATATYCPRKLYYRRREGGHEPPPEVLERRELAFRYPSLRAAEEVLADAPLAATPTQVRANLGSAAARLDCWDALADPPARDVFLEGKDARGIAHKVLEEPLCPSIVSAGDPPEQGAWAPDSVRAVAAAKALAWERQRPVERAFVEYPAHGIVRDLSLTTRRKARYRESLRVAETLDGPPSRVDNDEKCVACEFSDDCGVRTRSLLSRLGG